MSFRIEDEIARINRAMGIEDSESCIFCGAAIMAGMCYCSSCSRQHEIEAWAERDINFKEEE